WGPELAFYQINVEGTANVIDACRKHHVRQLIYTSSPSVVFPMGDLRGVDESQPYPAEYTALYPQTKALAEQAVLKANDEQLATCALRPHLIWGPGDRHILPLIIKQVKAGKLPQIGEGDNLVDMCYIDNAVHAHLCAQERVWPGSEAAGKAYFISDGAPVNLWDWIRKFTSALGLPPIKKKVPLQAALLLSGFSEVFHRLIPFLGEPKLTRFVVANLAFSHYFKIDAARNLLGYTPLVDEPEGFRRSVEWFRAHGESAP
ncbi:MAG: NAD-dependent epimerase/dehydratase family protein, partial [Lentisphaerae bacterium]